MKIQCRTRNSNQRWFWWFFWRFFWNGPTLCYSGKNSQNFFYILPNLAFLFIFSNFSKKLNSWLILLIFLDFFPINYPRVERIFKFTGTCRPSSATSMAWIFRKSRGSSESFRTMMMNLEATKLRFSTIREIFRLYSRTRTVLVGSFFNNH